MTARQRGGASGRLTVAGYAHRELQPNHQRHRHRHRHRRNKSLVQCGFRSKPSSFAQIGTEPADNASYMLDRLKIFFRRFGFSLMVPNPLFLCMGHNGPLVNCFSVFSDLLSLKVPKFPACLTPEFSSLKPLVRAIHILPYQDRLSGYI